MNDPRFADYFPNLKSATTAGNGLSALEQQKKKIAELEQAQLAASKAVALAEQKVQQHKNGRSKNHKDMSSEEEPSTSSSSSSTSPTYSTSSTTSSDDEDNPVRFSPEEVSTMLARMDATHKRPGTALSSALQPPQQKQKSQEQPQKRPQQQQLEEESESLGNDSKEEAEMIVAEEEVAEEEVETDSEEQAAELRANKKLVEQARKKRAAAKAKSEPPKQPLRTRSAAAATPKKAVPPRGAKGNVRPSVIQPEAANVETPALVPPVSAEKKPASQTKKQPLPASSPKVQSQPEKDEEEKQPQAMQVEATAKSAPQQKQQELTLVIEARKSLEASIAEMERLSALNALLKEELRKKQVELEQRESNVVGLEAREQELKKSQWSMDVNHASKTEEFEKKEASLAHREQTLAKREIELEKQATVDRQNAVRGGTEKEVQLKQREESLIKQDAELVKRGLALTEFEKGLEEREVAVQQRTKKIQTQYELNEKEKTRLATLSETLSERGRKQLVILNENVDEKAHLEKTRSQLDKDMEEYRRLQSELNERTNNLKMREADLRRDLEALELRSARVRESEAELEQKRQSGHANAVEQRVEQMKRDNVKHFNSLVRNYLTPMQFESFFAGLLDETLVLNTFIDKQYSIVLLSVRASGQELFRQVQLLDPQ